jgi:hypothetical protein
VLVMFGCEVVRLVVTSGGGRRGIPISSFENLSSRFDW